MIFIYYKDVQFGPFSEGITLERILNLLDVRRDETPSLEPINLFNPVRKSSETKREKHDGRLNYVDFRAPLAPGLYKLHIRSTPAPPMDFPPPKPSKLALKSDSNGSDSLSDGRHSSDSDSASSHSRRESTNRNRGPPSPSSESEGTLSSRSDCGSASAESAASQDESASGRRSLSNEQRHSRSPSSSDEENDSWNRRYDGRQDRKEEKRRDQDLVEVARLERSSSKGKRDRSVPPHPQFLHFPIDYHRLSKVGEEDETERSASDGDDRADSRGMKSNSSMDSDDDLRRSSSVTVSRRRWDVKPTETNFDEHRRRDINEGAPSSRQGRDGRRLNEQFYGTSLREGYNRDKRNEVDKSKEFRRDIHATLKATSSYGKTAGEKRWAMSAEELEIHLDSGIEAMMSSVASIPPRYFKYNVKLSKKVDSSITVIDRLQRKIESERISSAQRLKLKECVLMNLRDVWSTAWSQFAPLQRLYHVTDVVTPDTLFRAEFALHKLFLWKRISGLLDKDDHDFINNNTVLFRRGSYRPAYYYLYGGSVARDGQGKLVTRSLEHHEVISEIRKDFLDNVMRYEAYTDDALETILHDVIRSMRLEKHAMAQKDQGESFWDQIKRSMRVEFKFYCSRR